MRGTARVILLACAVLVLTATARSAPCPVRQREQLSRRPLPADVHPDSRNRLPPIKPGIQGLAAIRLHASGANVRWASPLGRSLTELAILTVAREHDQPYEWSLHEMEAVAVGLDPATIDIVRHRRPLSGVPGEGSCDRSGRPRARRNTRAQLEHVLARGEPPGQEQPRRHRRSDGDIYVDCRTTHGVQPADAARLEAVPSVAIHAVRPTFMRIREAVCR